MTPVAIFFMILAMLVIWGGLVLAVRHLVTHPQPQDDGDASRGPVAPRDT